MKKIKIASLAISIIGMPAFANSTTADLSSISLTATLKDLATNNPCVELSLSNKTQQTLGIDNVGAPWTYILIYLDKDNVPVPKSYVRPTAYRSLGHAWLLPPNKTLVLKNLVNADASHKACIELSHWGYTSLTPGQYQLRAASMTLLSPNERDDIEETRGVRTKLIHFQI